ncbi:T9SS type A sorting domain-containing protein [Flavobacterium sp. XGLA_31]|uniref:T9SS type A sorting domain-containing protein n=1 Tax=Flavobacterium sp. XGLA_31 TaxID=3447666 RepID=UPI003F31843E
MKNLIAMMGLLIGLSVQSQSWQLVNDLPQQEFMVVKQISGKLYAASENKLFSSTDGITWSTEIFTNISVTPTTIYAFGGKLHIGTMYHGVYTRALTTGGVWNHTLTGIHSANFIPHNGKLYMASTGFGVWYYDGNLWHNQTLNLPTYSYNVNKIVSANQTLYAFSGANGTFYKFDENGSSWTEDYYFNTLYPGLAVDDALLLGNILYVANGNKLLRSDDFGNNWTSDNIGLNNGVFRQLFTGSNSLYALTHNMATNYTYLQKRGLNDMGSSWGNFNELLPFYSYDLEEFNGKIYIASDMGLYSKSNELGIEVPINDQNFEVSIYPIPSYDGRLTILSNKMIKKVNITDLSGRIVFRENINSLQTDILLQTSGIYIVNLMCDDKIVTRKVIVN